MSEEVQLRGGRNLVRNSRVPFRVEYSGSGEENRPYRVGTDITAPLTIDNEYTISLTIRGNIQLRVYRISSSGNSAIPFVDREDLSETEYRRFSMTFKPHKNELTALYLTTGYNTGVSGWHEIAENSLKLEKGNTATDWTPAPEDLGLEYPDHVTHFGTYFKDNDMVTDEIVEFPEELKGGRNLIIRTAQDDISRNRNYDFNISSPLPKGKYIYHTWLKANRETSAQVYLNDDTGLQRTQWRSAHIQLTTEYQYYEIPINLTTTDEKSFDGVRMRVYGSSGDILTGKLTKLEKGSKATPWAPAPEDLGLEYPHYITHFGTYLKEGDMLEENLVGGRNLLRNSDFSSGSEFWSGQGSLADGGMLLEGTSGPSSLIQNITEVPEGEYTLQVWYEVLEGQVPYLFNSGGSDAQWTDGYPFLVDKEYFEVGVTIRASNLMFAFRYAGASPANHLVGKTLIKRVKLEKGNKATDWTPAPEDLGLNYPPGITYFEKNPQIQNVVSNEFVEFHEDYRGFDLRNPVDKISDEEAYTDQADDSVVHVEIDGKSYQHAGSGKNLLNPSHITEGSWINTDGAVSTDPKHSLARGIPVKPNTTYTFSGSPVIRQVRVVFFDSNINHISGFLDSSIQESITFTTPSNCYTLFISGDNNDNDGSRGSNTSTWQLEEGSVATEYEYPTPTPDYPIEIHSLNDFDVVSSVGRRNIYTGRKDIDHVLGMNNYTIATRLPVGEYTISFDYDVIEENMPIVNFLLYSSTSGSFSSVPIKTDSNSRVFRTFTITNDMSEGHIWLYAGQGASHSQANHVVFKEVKIEEGSAATPYSPALEDITENDNHSLIDKINLLLDEPLRSVGDVKDRLFRDNDGLWKVERNVGESVIAGGMRAYRYGLGAEGVNTFFTSFPNAKLGYHTSISSHFRNVLGGWDRHDYGVGYSDHPSTISKYFYFPDTLTGIVDTDSQAVAVKKVDNWLAKNPVIVVYQLETPTIETLDQELQDKLNNLRSFQDSNYVYTVNDKADNLSDYVVDNLKPTIHATFKSEDYGELAKDGLVYPDDITHLTTQVKYGTMVVSELIEGGGAYGNSTTRV